MENNPFEIPFIDEKELASKEGSISSPKLDTGEKLGLMLDSFSLEFKPVWKVECKNFLSQDWILYGVYSSEEKAEVAFEEACSTWRIYRIVDPEGNVVKGDVVKVVKDSK